MDLERFADGDRAVYRAFTSTVRSGSDGSCEEIYQLWIVIYGFCAGVRPRRQRVETPFAG